LSFLVRDFNQHFIFIFSSAKRQAKEFCVIVSPLLISMGTGKTDIAIYRASTGAWYIIPSSGGESYSKSLGGDPSDLPVTANTALIC